MNFSSYFFTTTTAKYLITSKTEREREREREEKREGIFSSSTSSIERTPPSPLP